MVHVCASRYRDVLQTDDSWSALVPDPAGADHDYVYVRVRRLGEDFNGRCSAAIVLPFGHYVVELFQRFVQCVVECVYQQCFGIREGLFPEAGGAVGRIDLQLVEVTDPAGAFHPGLYRLSDCGRAVADSPCVAAVPVPCAVAGFPRPFLGFDYLFGYLQVSRPEVPGRFWTPALYVRHADHLSAQRRDGSHPHRSGTQSADADFRGLQVRLPWLRNPIVGRTAL